MRNERVSERRTQLEAELSRLREQRSDLTPTADDDRVGDRGDDAQALERADELTWVDDRIKRIIRRLENPDSPPTSDDALPDGTLVTLRFTDGTVANMHVVAFVDEIDDVDESTSYAVLTADSPLGRALVGRRVGDNVSYDTPSGKAHAQVQAIQLPDTG